MKTQIGILGGVVVLLAAVGLGVFMFGGGSELDEVAAADDSGGDASLDETKAEEVSTAERDRENEEFLVWMEEEAAMAEEAEAQIAEEGETYVAAAETEYPEPEPEPVSFGDSGNSGGSMPLWQSIWADLNLTPEEEARLREGFSIAISRYMSMSPQEQAAERERMAQMRRRWESMSDEEREVSSQRLRDRFEDWRASGSVELPELSLD